MLEIKDLISSPVLGLGLTLVFRDPFEVISTCFQTLTLSR